MADVSYDKKATIRRAATDRVFGKGDAGNLKMLCSSTIELAASASGTTVKFGRIPADARISQRSRVYWDDLATSGSPTLDIGLASVDSNITSDTTDLNDGLDLSSADAEGVPLLKDHADTGKKAWEFNTSTEVQGELDVYGTIKDAATNATGTITVEVLGWVD